MDESELDRLLAGKEARRHRLARVPIEEKLRAVVRLQEIAAPILRARGRDVRPWRIEAFERVRQD